jgi:hypothetical protein
LEALLAFLKLHPNFLMAKMKVFLDLKVHSNHIYNLYYDKMLHHSFGGFIHCRSITKGYFDEMFETAF